MKVKGRKSKMPNEIIELGKMIELKINESNKKTREVAHDADLDVENLRKYIKGSQEMKVGTLLRIIKALEINIQDLFPSQKKSLKLK